MISKEYAENLAIAYSAFNDARKHGDANSILVWADRLMSAQNNAGIWLHNPEGLKRVRDRARADLQGDAA